MHFNLHCKHHGVIPKSLKIKSPIDNERARHLIQKTQRALLNIRITETIQKQKQIAYECSKVENELKTQLPKPIFDTLRERNSEREKIAFAKSTEIQKNKFKILTNRNTRHQVIADTNTSEPESNTNGNETQQWLSITKNLMKADTNS